VRVVSKKKLREYWQMPGRGLSEAPLKTWFDVAEKATWRNFADVKVDFGANVDMAYGKYVFDIKGNSFRLICAIDFVRHGVLVLWVGTHREYDELNKNDGRKLRQL